MAWNGLPSGLPLKCYLWSPHTIAVSRRLKMAGIISGSPCLDLDGVMLGDAGDDLDAEVAGFLLRSPTPSSTDVASFLQLYSGSQRTDAAQRLIAKGVSPTAVSGALNWLDASSQINWGVVKNIATVVSAGASAYHGLRRNDGSIGWGIWWFVCGTLFPVFTPIVALAQGFARPKKG